MSRPLRTTSSGTFFLTAIAAQRRRIFQVEANSRLFLETLQHYRREGLYKLHAFVLMPDHIHLLITTDTPASDEAHPRRFLSSSGHEPPHLATRLHRPPHPHRDDFIAHRDYIHQNPVRAHLCQLPEDYPYSSAYQPNPVKPPNHLTPTNETK